MKGVSLAAVLLGLATALLYWQSVGHDFVNYDDDVYVTANPMVRAGLASESVAWAFTTFHAANWHPLTWLSHMLDVELFGLEPGGHHRTNVLLHVGVVLLLLASLVRMTRRPWPSFWVAGIFALHPLRVESVAWVSERKDLLCAVAWMLALWFYAGWARERRKGAYLAVLLCLGFGLLSKPMIVTLPCVLLLLDLWPLERWRAEGARTLILEKLPLFGLVGVSSCMTLWAQGEGGAIAALQGLSVPERAANAALAYGQYVWKSLAPTGLAVFYPHPAVLAGEDFSWFGGKAVGVLAGLLALSALALRWRATAPAFLVGWLWFLGTLVPVIGLVQVGHQAWADRYSYLPCIGLAIAIGFSVERAVDLGRLPRRPVIGAGLTSLVAVAFLTSAQLPHWADSVRLWERALAVTENNYLAHYNLGLALEEQGEAAGAREHYARAVRIHPGYGDAHYALGLLELRSGQLAAAERSLRAAVEADPALAAAHGSLGLLERQRNDPAAAIEHYRRALELQPDLVETRNNLGSALIAQQDFDGAEKELRLVLERDPDFVQARLNLALLHERRGDFARAIEGYRQAFRQGTPHPLAADKLARLLLAKPGATVAEKEEALELARYALQETGGGSAGLELLARCHAALGQFEQAVEWQGRALEAAPAARKEALGAQLERYRSGGL